MKQTPLRVSDSACLKHVKQLANRFALVQNKTLGSFSVVPKE